MSDALIIYDGPGPLPIAGSFTTPVDGPVVLVLSGTARTDSAATLTGIQLYLDGNPVGQPAMCWANQNDNHIAMRTTFISIENLSYGDHSIEIAIAYEGTVTDVNDYFQLTLLY